MPITKTEEFGTKDQRLSRWAKALSHPARIAILKVIAKRNACICGEIVELMPLAQATVSQHLKELKAAGLIKGTIDGPKSCYCINPDAIQELASDLHNFLDGIQGCCVTKSCSAKKEIK